MAKVKKEKISELEKLDIDKDKIVKEIKSDVEEKIFDEVTKKIDYETQNKLDKMEKRIYRHKNFSILKRDIIILLFLGVIIYETIMLYNNGLLFGLNKFNESKEEEVVVEKDEKTNEEEKDLNWYIDNYGYLLDNIKTNLEDTTYLYNNIKVSDIDSSIKINMAYQILNKEYKNIENGVITVDASKLSEVYKKIFTDDIKHQNFKDNCIQFIYNKENNNYMAIDTQCEKKDIIRVIDNIREDHYITIDILVGILDDKNLTNISGDILKEDYSSKDFEEIKNKLDKFEFIYEKIKDKYYLKEIKKVKIYEQ